MKFATKAIHAGLSPDESTGAIMTPIYQTSTYVQTDVGVHKGFEYSRTQNPTRQALEKNFAAIENAKYGLAFASGMAATDVIIKLLSPGDEVISTSDLYGGTYRIFTTVYENYGVQLHFDALASEESVRALITDKTKMIWVETPTNPTLKILDIKMLARVAKSCGAILVVDNTFASPYLQNPLDLGADIVMHSGTKYLAGHSDVVIGMAAVNDGDLDLRLRTLQNTCGGVPGPQDCFLTLRGIKTLHIRMQRHCENAVKIANFLKNHDKVDKIYWPGLADHPNHEVAKDQMRDFGGMMSFTLVGNDYETARKIVSTTKLFSLAESLGGVESLIGHPASMTHAAIPKEKRESTGVVDSLLRLSIGIEDADDLISDLKQAMG